MGARERKRKVQAKSKQAVTKATHRSGRVRIVQAAKKESTRPKQQVHPSFKYDYRKPKGLSPEARWMEKKPEGWNMLDWLALFDSDESLWDDIWEEAYESTMEGQGED